MGRPPGRVQDRPFQMRVSGVFLRAIDRWRNAQEDTPSRAEAIRRLVEQALTSNALKPRRRITAQMVKQLREKTGAPIMLCKAALSASDGEPEAAVDWMRRRALAKSAEGSPTRSPRPHGAASKVGKRPDASARTSRHSQAEKMAAEQIDRVLKNVDQPEEEKAKRKRRLTKGPAEFRKP
jgi:hypothetical protein